MTKIIGTIGPSSIQIDTLQRLKSAGLSSFRINLSHSNKELLEYYYQQFKSASITPSLDTQGAQVRVSFLKNKEFFVSNEKFSIGKNSCAGVHCDIGINCLEFFDAAEIGDEIKIGFDGLIGKIISINPNIPLIEAEVLHTGKIELNKAVDISNKFIDLPPFTEFDIECISNSQVHGIEEIYVSFCDSRDCVLQLRSMLIESGWSKDNMPRIIAKIESKRGLLNLESIMTEVDGILIDRGDLSREIRISMIPGVVHQVITWCLHHTTPCYVATNIVDSMLKEKLPSRAEISDIYNLLSAGVSGFVLAAEVAIGDHPVESLEVVRYMSKVFFNQQNQTDVDLLPEKVIPDISEPLLSWL